MKSILTSALLSFLAFAGSAQGATFTRFSPATGVLVGDESSYVTTSAVSADITGLWSGTCDATTFLRGDGSCQPEPNVGTVTSVGLTMPTGFSVANSPITTSGSLDVTTLLDGLIVGTGSGFAEATSADVIELWTGTCDAINFLGGDGACKTAVTSVGLTVPSGFTVTGSPVTTSGTLGIETTLSGVIAGTGSGFTTATSANVIDLWSGTCTAATEYLAADGTCQSITFANPTASIGLTAVNGVATTYMRSDAAPPLDQSISPTWTGSHVFNQDSGVGLTITRSTVPSMAWIQSGATVDNRRWDLVLSSEQLLLRATSDDVLSANSFLIVDRTGTVIDTVSMRAGSAGRLELFADTANTQARVQGVTTGNSNIAFVAFRDSANSRTGYVGDTDSANSDVELACETGNCNVRVTVASGSGTFLANGSAVCTQASGCPAPSDIRLKKNVQDSLSAGSKIDSIRVRSFDWRENDSHVEHGLIAQELYEIEPAAVQMGGDNPEEKPWAVDPSKLVPMLVKEIQDLRKRVAELEAAN